MKQQQAISAIPYILAFLALVYLALPHVVECYESYARPWNSREEMTNADVAAKQEHHEDKDNTVWEMFTETEVKTDKTLSTILPGETVKPAQPKSILPGVPTPKMILPGMTKHEVEPAVDKPPESLMGPREEKTNARLMDVEVQKPVSAPAPKKPAPAPVPRVTKVSKPPPPRSQSPKKKDVDQSGEQIWGPRAPKLDPNQPRPSDSGNGKHGGIYPYIYGPDSLDPPGSKDKGGDSSNPPPFDFIPAAEFPAGPLQPSPYLNDFSKILKT
jgi:hypothetical protein